MMNDREVSCPFFKRDRGNGKIYCEAAVFQCPDTEFRRDLLYGFCAHPEAFRGCMLFNMLMCYYERKFSDV